MSQGHAVESYDPPTDIDFAVFSQCSWVGTRCFGSFQEGPSSRDSRDVRASRAPRDGNTMRVRPSRDF